MPVVILLCRLSVGQGAKYEKMRLLVQLPAISFVLELYDKMVVILLMTLEPQGTKL